MMCPECGEVLESKYRHDFVQCHCTNRAFVDGGDAYMRAGALRAMPVPYNPELPPEKPGA